MGLSGFEPESRGPKPRRLAKLPHNPIKIDLLFFNCNVQSLKRIKYTIFKYCA